MMLKIRKLGPIKRGDIKLGDITIFLGPPNTGKSYALKAIYSKLFLIDDYVLDSMIETLTDTFVTYLGYDFVESVLTGVRNLLTTMVEAFTITVFLQNDFDSLKKYVRSLAEEKALDIRIETQKEWVSINIKSSTLSMGINTKILNDIFSETIREFINDIVPLEEETLIESSPLDISKINMDYIASKIQHEYKNEIEEVIPWLDEPVEFLYNYIRRVFVHESNGARRPVSIIVLRRRLRLGMYIRYRIQFNENRFKIFFTPTISLRMSLPFNLSIKKSLAKAIENKDILESVKEIIKRTSSTTLIYYRDRAIDYLKHVILSSSAEEIFKVILQALREQIKNYLGFSYLHFIPFGRSILISGIESASREPITRSEFLSEFVGEFYPDIIGSYVYWTSKGRSVLLDNRLTGWHKKLLSASTPLLEGKLLSEATDRILYRDWRGSIIDLQMSSALVGEVSGIILNLLSAGENALVLIEEPEAQLHPGAQIIMALFLAALPSLCGCKVVASTHSDLLAITLSQLKVQKPSKKQIAELIISLLPHVREGVDILAEAVARSVENLDLRIYEFTREGIVKSVEPEDVLGKEVPGISRVIDILTDWAFRLASSKASEG